LTLCASDQKDQFLVVIDPDQCILCSDLLGCEQCTSSSTCEWLAEQSECVRKGRFKNAIRHTRACTIPCHRRRSCESCLEETGLCVWCRSNQQCTSASSFHSSFSLFEFCQTFDAHLFMHNAYFLNKGFLNN